MRPVFSFPTVTILECAPRRVMVATWQRAAAGGWRWLRSSNQPLTGDVATEAAWLAATVLAIPALGAPAGPVMLVLPAERTLTKMCALPPVAAAAREKIIRFELGQTVPVPLAELGWACTSASEASTGGLTAVFAVKRSVVETLCAASEAAGLAVQAVWPAPLAALAAFRGQIASPTLPCVFVMPTATATVLGCVEAHRWALRVVVGAAVAAHDTETLTREIARTSAAFATQHGFAPPQTIYWAGDAASAAPGPSHLGGLRVEAWSADGADTGAEAERPSAIMRGAARLGWERGLATADLLPPERRAARGQRRRRPWLLAAAVLVLAAWVPPLVDAHRQVEELESRSGALAQDLAEWRARAARMRESAAQLTAAQTELAAWRDVAAQRTHWVRRLADWQERLAGAGDAWLETVRGEPGEPGGPARLVVAGWLLDRENPPSAGSAALVARVQHLRASLALSPFVATLLAERYDTTRPGRVRFEWVFASQPASPL